MLDPAVAGPFIIGVVVGALFAIFMFWDRQYAAGRAQGFREGQRSRAERELAEAMSEAAQ